LPPSGALKIVFQLEQLSDRVPLELLKPDNSNTFVSSPQPRSQVFLPPQNRLSKAYRAVIEKVI
jgi:hypothetical protein